MTDFFITINGIPVGTAAAGFAVTTDPQITADQDNYSVPSGPFNELRLETDAVWNITGFAGDGTAQYLVVANFGAFDLQIPNEDPGSLGQNRVITGTGATVVLQPDDTAILIYDTASLRWRML
jgi:hypothetical protein